MEKENEIHPQTSHRLLLLEVLVCVLLLTTLIS